MTNEEKKELLLDFSAFIEAQIKDGTDPDDILFNIHHDLISICKDYDEHATPRLMGWRKRNSK